MAMLTLSRILDDLRAAENGLHQFERRYWISSDSFYDLYAKGLLDDGENAEDFAEWAGHYRLRQKRLQALERISQERLAKLPRLGAAQTVQLVPAEPVLESG